MATLLAYAQTADTADTSLRLMVVWVGMVLGTAILAFIVVRLAGRRRPGAGQALFAGSILWAILTAGVLINESIQQTQWSRERQLRIQSGYYEFYEDSESLPLPWRTWGVLGTIYGGLLLRAVTMRRRTAVVSS